MRSCRSTGPGKEPETVRWRGIASTMGGGRTGDSGAAVRALVRQYDAARTPEAKLWQRLAGLSIPPAQFGDALFASQPFQHDPHLLFRRVLLSCLLTDLPYPFFCRHFLFHPILLKIVSIWKVPLSFSGGSARNALTGYRSDHGGIGSPIFARTLGIRTVTDTTPVCNSRPGRKPLRTIPAAPASVRRPPCCTSSSSYSAPTACRSSSVSGSAIPSRSSGSITLLLIIVAYRVALKSGKPQINPIRRSSSISQTPDPVITLSFRGGPKESS